MSKFAPEVTTARGRVYYWQDFRQGRSDADLMNVAVTVIYNVAHVYDHFRKWAGRDSAKLKTIESLRKIPAYQVIRDLSDSDKHGGQRRDGGWSGLSPRLGEVNAVLRLTTGAEPGSSAAVVLTSRGPAQVGGSGSMRSVVTADIIGSSGERVGDLYKVATEAIGAVEDVAQRLGVLDPHT